MPAAIVEPGNSIEEPHHIMFDQIDGQMIQMTVLLTDGAFGPSGLDAAAWKRLSSSFDYFSENLCDALASIAR